MGIRKDQKKIFREAIRNLSGYYGVKDANSFMSILLASSTDENMTMSSLEAAKDFAQEGSLDELADILLSTTGDGLYLTEMIAKIDEYCNGNKSDPVAEGFLRDPANGKCPLLSVTTLDKQTGADGFSYKRGADVRQILNTESQFSNVQGEMKSIGVIEVHHPNLNFANRDTAAASIFLQSLPSVEMSKAVPYFDCKIITKGDPVAPDPSGDNENESKLTFSNGISIYRFLQGDEITADDTVTRTLIGATPVEFIGALPSVGGTAGEQEQQEVQSITVAGMEVFTTPQTLTDGTLTYTDLDTTNTEEVAYKNKILDKFRPFLTLTSFTSNVAPSVGPLSTESASMKIKLHDKTRLKEIAPLVVPGQLGTVELMIDYGWSHPQTDPAENPYGALINSMKRRSKWGIVNSSYNFSPTGEVDIDLKLITKGAANTAFELISNTGGNRPDENLKKAIKKIRNTFRDLKAAGYSMNEEMGAPDVIGKTTSMKGLNSIEPEDWKKISKFLQAMKKHGGSTNSSKWTDLERYINDAKTKQVSLLKELKDRFRDQMSKCAYVVPSKRRRFVKSKKPTSKKGNKSVEQALQNTSSGGRPQQSDPSAINDDGTLAQPAQVSQASDLNQEASPPSTTTPSPKPNTNGQVNAISVAVSDKQKKKEEKKPASSGYYVTIATPWDDKPKTQTVDPYIVTDKEDYKKTTLFSISETSHVSFAKLLLHFVAEPLSNTGKFDEVQLYFYPINEYAMWARGLNVGQYPINKLRFQEVFEEALTKSASMSIQAFVNIIARNFFQYQGDDIYGLSTFYGKNEKGKMAIKERYQKDETAKIKFTESKQDILNLCYSDSPIRKFKKPQIKMHIDCVPHQSNEGETVLRLHFFDQAVDSYSSYTQLWQATSSAELGTVGKYASKIRKRVKTNPPPEGGNNSAERKEWEKLKTARDNRITEWKSHFEAAFKTSDGGQTYSLGDVTLEKIDIKLPESSDSEKEEPHVVYKVVGGPDQLRGILAKNMPTLKYGTEYSGILNASLSTQSDPSMETINMKRQGVGNVPQGVVDDGLPLTVRPVQLQLDVFGCPFVYFGQQFFVDFQTNTTIDDVYTVTSISHTISEKEFKTQLKLVPLNKLGQYRSMATTLATIGALSKDLSEKLKKESGQ